MDNIQEQAVWLARALGPSAARIPDLSQRLAAVGGLAGLARGGGECLRLSARLQIRLEAMLELYRQMAVPPKLEVCESPQDVVRCLGPSLVGLRVETLWVVLLDARARPFAYEEVARGTLSSCSIHPREVLLAAVKAAAASFIMVHNHPSGDPEPSQEDHRLTDQMGAAGLLLGIPMIDHIVVAAEGYRSLGPGRFAEDMGAGWGIVRAAGLACASE